MILNYSTKIDAWKTVGEIQQILAKSGALNVSLRNEKGEPVAITFALLHDGFPLNFSLPCNSAGVLRTIKRGNSSEVSRAKSAGGGDLEKQARNVGWRILKDWIEAQGALIEVEMASMAEVFMPYLVINTTTGETLSNRILTGGGLKQLNH